jgi:hypothetical protein
LLRVCATAEFVAAETDYSRDCSQRAPASAEKIFRVQRDRQKFSRNEFASGPFDFEV